MNAFHVCLSLVIGASLLLQGCGKSAEERIAEIEKRNRAAVSTLEAKLDKSGDKLSAEKEKNTELLAEVQRLKGEVRELEEKVSAQTAAQSSVAAEPASPPAGADLNPEDRVGLMGAKALSDFKAKQLSQRLDKLTKDLEAKEAELKKIRDNAQKKEAEVSKLAQALERLQAEDAKRTEEVTGKLDALSKDLSARTEDAKRFKQELDEKSEFLAALKSSVSDCGKVRSLAETESQRLQSELTQTSTKLKTAEQQLTQAQQDLENYKALQAEMSNQIEQWSTAAYQFRQKQDAANQEVAGLKKKVTELQAQLGAGQSPREEVDSPIDQLLEGPTEKKPTGLRMPLF
jgi:chromosome segregation ATPase